MRKNTRIDFRQTLLHGAVGALAAAAFTSLFLAFDVFGIGFLLDWAQSSLLHATALLYKPAMLGFVAALSWSAWRQLETQAERSRRRAGTAPVSGRLALSRR